MFLEMCILNGANKGMSPKEAAKYVFGNVYTQWGNIEYQKVNDIITSMFGN